MFQNRKSEMEFFSTWRQRHRHSFQKMEKFMNRKTSYLVAALAFVALSAQAQTTCQYIGNQRVCSDPYGNSATTQRIGNQNVTNYSNGQSATTQRIGSQTVTNYSNGDSATSQQIGNQRITQNIGSNRIPAKQSIPAHNFHLQILHFRRWHINTCCP